MCNKEGMNNECGACHKLESVLYPACYVQHEVVGVHVTLCSNQALLKKG